MSDPLARALAIAQRQYGLITRWQLLEVGVHRRTLDRMLSAGRLEIVERGVYRVVGTPRTWEQRALAITGGSSCATPGTGCSRSLR